MKYTPGPWITEYEGRHVFSIHAPDGDPDLEYKTWYGLATVYGCYEKRRIGADKAKANAYLIAAAPDLLENLEYRLSQIRCGCGHPACTNCRDDAETESIIANARGDK